MKSLFEDSNLLAVELFNLKNFHNICIEILR